MRCRNPGRLTVSLTMGLLRRWLWWRDRYPSWSFWLGLVTGILLALVLYPIVIVTLCLDLVKLISPQPHPQPHPSVIRP